MPSCFVKPSEGSRAVRLGYRTYVFLRYPQQILSLQELLGVLSSRFARWQLPRLSDIHCVGFLPKTSVGKLDKKSLRSALM